METQYSARNQIAAGSIVSLNFGSADSSPGSSPLLVKAGSGDSVKSLKASKGKWKRVLFFYILL